MPHPQDVAVPSLPLSEILALAIKLNVANVDFEEQAEIDVFLHTFGNACYEAGRAAGRASAEPELPDGWVPCLITYEGDEPEEVAFGPKPMMDRLTKWLTRYFAQVYAERYPASPTPTASSAPKAEAPWEHLKQYGYAPGGYLSKCHACEKVVEFVDKRAITCRPCAEAMHAAPKAEGEAVELLRALWKSLRERHHGRMPDDVEKAYDAAAKFLVCYDAAPVAQAAAGASAFTDSVRTDLRRFARQLSAMARAQEAGHPWDAYDRSTLNLVAHCLELAAFPPRPEADADRASGGGV